MIRIKDYIFNEKEILQISKGVQNTLSLTLKSSDRLLNIDNATFEDIEWNYGTPQETQRQIQKELCKSCYYRDTVSNKLKELEEKNKTFEDYNKDLNNQLYKLEEELKFEKTICSNQARRILKAIEYINDNVAVCAFNNKELPHWEFDDNNIQDLIKILKGENNE